MFITGIIVIIVLMLVGCGAKTVEETTEVPVVVAQPVLEKGRDVEETVVVETEDDSGGVEVSSEVEMKIEGYAFEERTLTIKAGTTVTWTNEDVASHTVTGDAFDSGKLSQGAKWSYRFTEPGTYTYYCAYHPSMTATVIVE